MSKWMMTKSNHGGYLIFHPNKSGNAMQECKTREEAIKIRKELNYAESEKFKSLTRIYIHVQIRDMPLFKKMVINEIRESGFKEVEKEAWKHPRNKKIFGDSLLEAKK